MSVWVWVCVCGVVAKRWPTATAATASIEHLVSADCLRRVMGSGQRRGHGDGCSNTVSTGELRNTLETQTSRKRGWSQTERRTGVAGQVSIRGFI